jgi:hypothetical protein
MRRIRADVAAHFLEIDGCDAARVGCDAVKPAAEAQIPHAAAVVPARLE